MHSKLQFLVKIAQVALVLSLCFGGSIEAGDYECEKCRRNVQECWKSQKQMSGIVSGISMAATCRSMENTCDRICSGRSANTPSDRYRGRGEGSSLPRVPLNKTQLRYMEIQDQVFQIVSQHEQVLQMDCLEQSTDPYSGFVEFCVSENMFELTQSQNVRKIMKMIGANPKEYNLVYMAIQESSMTLGY